MQATITYLLTEQAQRAQMAATGQPVARKQTMTIEVPAADLDLLPIGDDGTISVDLSENTPSNSWREPLVLAGWPTWNGSYGLNASAINPPFLADLRRGRELLKIQKQEAEQLMHANGDHNRRQTAAAYAAFLADPSARIGYGELRGTVGDVRSPADWWPEEEKGFERERERRRDLDDQAKKRAEVAKETAKIAAIDAFIGGLQDDEVLQQQHADGMLCRNSALSLMADAIFTAAGVPDAVEDFTACRDSDCPCGHEALDCLPRKIYAKWRALNISDRINSVKFEGVRRCLKAENEGYQDQDGETAGPIEYHAVITLQSGPFQFVRRIKL